VVALASAAFTPASRWVVDRASGIGAGLSPATADLIALVVFAAALVIWWQLAALPARLYLGLRVDKQYGPETAPTTEAILEKQWHATLLALPAVVAAALAIRASVWIGGPVWWLVAGGVGALGLAAGLFVAPRILRWGAEAKPLDRGDLGARLATLAATAGVPVREVSVVPAERGGPTAAAVSGTGASRRIFVSADLLRDWTDDEIAVVVAHELGHHAHEDLRRSAAIDAALLTLGLVSSALVLALLGAPLGLSGAADIAALPLIALVTGGVWIAATPLRLAVSRRQERRADAFALALTGSADAFDAAIRRLGARYLAEERPGLWTRWLFHRHPPVAERLEYARVYRRLKEV
jgi:STE24 endopeptidase